MPKPSKIERLPAEIRDEIGALRDRGYTLDEILGHLRALDIPPGSMPSRSGLGRHVKGLAAISERLARSRAIAEAMVRRYGDAPESRTARLNIELLHSIVFDLVAAVGDGTEDDSQPVTLDAKQVHDLSKALDHLARAAKSDLDTARKQIETFRADADRAVEKVAATQGLSRDTVAALKAEFLGIGK